MFLTYFIGKHMFLLPQHLNHEPLTIFTLYCMYALYILIATYALIMLFRTYISVCVYDNNGSIIIQNEALASTTTILSTNSISEG